MTKKQKITIVAIAFVAVIGVIVTLFVLLTTGKDNSYTEHLKLAEQYIDDLQYEQAIAELRAAIDIEPDRAEAYIRLADVYMEMGDTDSAIAVLEEGYRITGDEEISEILEMLKNRNEQAEDYSDGVTESEYEDVGMPYKSELDRLIAEGDTGDMLAWDEVTFFGSMIPGLNLDSATALLQGNGFQIYNEDVSSKIFTSNTYDTRISVLQNTDAETVSLINIDHYKFYDGPAMTTEIRGITMRDSVETVFNKLGFDNASEINVYLQEAFSKEYGSFEEIEIPNVNYYCAEKDLIIIFQWKSLGTSDGKCRLDKEFVIEFNYWFEGGGTVWFDFDENGLLQKVSLFNY